MCIFSRAVRHVSSTSIFARGFGGEQILAYALDVAAAGELAMILPLPVAPECGEEATRFIDLSPYPKFFDDLRRAFPSFDLLGYGVPAPAAAAAPQTLRVQRVGSFDASFVPTLADFDRLDPRFRLSPGVWRRLPQYADFGFAVFELRPGTEPESIHPMALAFVRRDPRTLFFPTLHVHDESVHADAAFDHELYGQFPAAPERWLASAGPLGGYVDPARVPDLVDPNEGAHRLVLRGRFPNRDVIVDAHDR